MLILLTDSIMVSDYNTLLKLPLTGKESKEIQNVLQKLKPRLEAAQKRETTEMLNKLKTLGNSFLGRYFSESRSTTDELIFLCQAILVCRQIISSLCRMDKVATR